MTFKEKLVILRKMKGITQDDFASAVGVSRQAVYKWECGQSYPEVPKLIEMKLLFGISLDNLLDDNYDIPLPEKKKKRISKATKQKIEASVDSTTAENAAISEIMTSVAKAIDVKDEPKAAPAPKATPAPAAAPAPKATPAPAAAPAPKAAPAPAAAPAPKVTPAPAAAPAPKAAPAPAAAPAPKAAPAPAAAPAPKAEPAPAAAPAPKAEPAPAAAPAPEKKEEGAAPEKKSGFFSFLRKK